MVTAVIPCRSAFPARVARVSGHSTELGEVNICLKAYNDSCQWGWRWCELIGGILHTETNSSPWNNPSHGFSRLIVCSAYRKEGHWSPETCISPLLRRLRTLIGRRNRDMKKRESRGKSNSLTQRQSIRESGDKAARQFYNGTTLYCP
jgi:hypothetical protein